MKNTKVASTIEPASWTLTYPSLPGLTRQSIALKKLSFAMDARVKPGHDESDL